MAPPFSIHVLVPDVVIELDLTGLVVVLTGIKLNFADFVVGTFELVLLVGDIDKNINTFYENSSTCLRLFNSK